MKDYRIVVELQKPRVIEGRTGFGYETIDGFTKDLTQEEADKLYLFFEKTKELAEEMGV